MTEERTDKYLDIFLRPMQHSSLCGRLDSGGKEEEEEEEGEQRDEGEEEEEAEAAAALMEAKTIISRRKGREGEGVSKRERETKERRQEGIKHKTHKKI